MNPQLLNDFIDKVQAIRDCWISIEASDTLITSLTDPIVSNLPVEIVKLIQQIQYRKNRTEKKIFNYKASIISLYGILESSIELWIKEYIDTICQFYTNYSDLEEAFRDRHFENSLDLAKRIRKKDEAKYQHLTKEGCISLWR